MIANKNLNPLQVENLETLPSQSATTGTKKKSQIVKDIKIQEEIMSPPIENLFDSPSKGANSDFKKVYILPSNQMNSFEVSLQGELFLTDMLNDAEITRERFNETLEKINTIVRQSLARQIFAKKIEVNTRAKKFVYISFILTIISFIFTGIAAKFGDWILIFSTIFIAAALILVAIIMIKGGGFGNINVQNVQRRREMLSRIVDGLNNYFAAENKFWLKKYLEFTVEKQAKYILIHNIRTDVQIIKPRTVRINQIKPANELNDTNGERNEEQLSQ